MFNCVACFEWNYFTRFTDIPCLNYKGFSTAETAIYTKKVKHFLIKQYENY